MNKCNINLEELLKAANTLLEISNTGDIDRDDSSCGVLYGIARDSAFKLIQQTEAEILKHKDSGKWK